MTLRTQNGFLLMEVLIVILILSVSFVAFMGVIGQALQVVSRSSSMMDAVGRYESLLFEMECGIRDDLTIQGGRGDLGNGFYYQIIPLEGDDYSSAIKSIVVWRSGRDSMDLECVLLKGPAQ